MRIAEAQHDLRRAYVGGGPGVILSGLVWLVAAAVERAHGVGAGFTALFFGGMLIFPLSKLACRAAFKRANEAATNPFGMTVLECTIAMMVGLFAAWLFLPSQPALVFPLAALAVGTHYFVFKTAYGDPLFWLLALCVTAIGFADLFVAPMRGLAAPLVAGTELAFGLWLTLRALSAPPETKRAA